MTMDVNIFKKIYLFYFIYVNALPMYMYVYHCVLGVCGGQMKISDILEMAAMNCHVDAGK